MPKFLKDTMIELWQDEPSYQDSAGAWHGGGHMQVATLWCSFKGKAYTELYQTQGIWAEPVFEATIERPRKLKIRVGDHVRHDGEFYRVQQINDLTGRPRSDMKLVCQLDEQYRA